MRRRRSRSMLIVLAMFLLLALVAPLPAQGNRRDQLIEANIEALADAERAPAAVRTLENLGAAAVPALRRVLAPPRRLQEPAARLQNALLVLGRLGAPALPAVREIHDIVAVDEGFVLRQAMWTMSQLAPHLDDSAHEATRQVLAQNYRALNAGGADYLVAIVHAQLNLGPDPPLSALAAAIARDEFHAVAACEHLRARPPGETEDRRPVLDALETRLASAMARPALHWEQRDTGGWAAGYLAVAWRTLSQQTGGALVARALLFHWDEDEQQRGVLWLKDHGAALPVRERGDLIALSWSGTPAVSQACADALAAWGKPGLAGLPVLRRKQLEATDAALQARNAAAADAIVASFATEGASTRALVAAIDAVLLGKPGTDAPLPPRDAGTAAVWPELLFGAQWCTGTTASALLDLSARTGAIDEATIAAVVPWILNADPDFTRAALAWLACRGGAVAMAMKDGDALRNAVWYRIPPSERGAGIEAIAWVEAPPDADAAVLRAALGTDEMRLVCRALSSLLLAHPGALPLERARLHQLLDAHVDRFGPLVAGGRGVRFDSDLAPTVCMLAAVALAMQGEAVDSDRAAREVRAYCGVALDEVPLWLSEKRARGTLAAWLDSVEAECRRELECVEGTWPTLAGAR